MKLEITDRFGEYPTDVAHLFETINLKILAKAANVEKLDIGNGFLILSFHAVVEKHSEKVFQLIKNNPQKVKVRPNNKVQVVAKAKTPVEKINAAGALLKSLA